MPTPVIQETKIAEDGVEIRLKRQFVPLESVETGEEVTAGVWIREYAEVKEGTLTGWKIIEERAIPGNPILSTRVNGASQVVTVWRTLKETSEITAQTWEVDDVIYRRFGDPVSELVSWEVLEAEPLFPGESYSIERPDPLPPKFRILIPAIRTSLKEAGTAEMPELGTGELSRSETQSSEHTKDVSVVSRDYGTDPLPTFEGKRIGRRGEIETITESIETTNTVSGGLHVVEASSDATGDGRFLLTKSEVASWTKQEGGYTDPRLGNTVDIEVDVVAAGTAIPAAANLISYRMEPEDKWRSILVKTTKTMPEGFTEHRVIGYAFPTLFLSYTHNQDFGPLLVTRDGYSCLVNAKVVTTFGSSEEELSPLVIKPVGWNYPFGCNMRGALTDGENITFYGSTSNLVAAIPTSTPTRTAYQAMIGTEQLVGGSSERIEKGIYRTEKIYIKMQ